MPFHRHISPEKKAMSSREREFEGLIKKFENHVGSFTSEQIEEIKKTLGKDYFELKDK